MLISQQKYITKYHAQTGQTLVETMVAALVLVIGIGAAVSLAVYGLGATTSVKKQLIGIGLAREGVEAIKNMRDTNWLNGVKEPDCWNFYSQADDANCYYSWLYGPPYNIDPAGLVGTYTLGFNAENAEQAYWQLVPTATNFGLNFSPKTPEEGFYSTGGSSIPVASATSDYARKITITEDNSFEPFDTSTGPRLKVTVDVWWKDKRCPTVTDPGSLPLSCKVTLETYLTNWKDY